MFCLNELRYFSHIHNLNALLSLSLFPHQVEYVAAAALETLASGHAVVIGLQTTGEVIGQIG